MITPKLTLGDARDLDRIEDESVHLVVTSPPYHNLKAYPPRAGQLGNLEEYKLFLKELDQVWGECFRVLVEGGRLVVVAGDVCRSRRAFGAHQVLPLSADLTVRCREIGFHILTGILWSKIANCRTEANRSSSFLGKPYEPDAIIKNDVEHILMLRKPGEYRHPTEEQRRQSKLTKEEFSSWFRSIWTDLPGASTREHPAPFPVELPYRLIRMFSFVGDTVLDPFVGSGSTLIAAVRAERKSIGIDVDPGYIQLAERRILLELGRLTGREG